MRLEAPRSATAFSPADPWYRHGDLRLEELVTARGGLDDVDEAFARMTRGEGLRTILVPN